MKLFQTMIVVAISVQGIACATAAGKLPDVNHQTGMFLGAMQFCTNQKDQASKDTCIQAMKVTSVTAIEVTKAIAEAAKPAPYNPGYYPNYYSQPVGRRAPAFGFENYGNPAWYSTTSSRGTSSSAPIPSNKAATYNLTPAPAAPTVK